MKRRLIKVPILTWTFLIVCGYNIYQIVYPDEAVCQTEKVTDPNQVYVFTRLSQTTDAAPALNSHLKMIIGSLIHLEINKLFYARFLFYIRVINKVPVKTLTYRRQFKHLVDKEANTFVEYFLDQQGQMMNGEWEDSFEDTYFTADPILTMLEFIAGPMSTVSTESIFVFMSDCLFDLHSNVSSILRESIDFDYHGLYCLNGVNSELNCNDDYFAFNYKTANSMRHKLLNLRSAPKTQEVLLNLNREIAYKRNGTEIGTNQTSVFSAFFNDDHSLLTAQKYNLSPAAAIDCQLIKFKNINDFASVFNVERTKGLQPRYVPDKDQPLLRYLKRPMSSCANGDLVVFVKCARSDEFQRNWIRKYARQMAKTGDFEMDLIFLLGSGKDQYKTILDQEADDYNDILIGGFLDTYDNLPIKTYLGYQYFAEFCSTKKYVIFQDSDAFTMLDEIMTDFRKDEEFEKSPLPWERSKLVQPAIYCIKGRPLPYTETKDETFPKFGRHYVSKWFYWLDEIDPKYELPHYCNGNCNALNGKAALRIWEQAQKTDRKGFRIEDLYFLGFMRQKAEVEYGEKIKVVSVTEATNNDVSRKALFNRCIHMSDARMIRDGDIRKAPDLARGYVSEEEKFNFVSDWYLNGDWRTYNKTFMYGVHGDHLMGMS